MKNTVHSLLALSLIALLFGCNGAGTNKKGDATQQLSLSVDGDKKTADPAPVISAAFTSGHLVLGYLSEKDDVQLSISAFIQDLKAGTYQVYDCKAASECNESMPDNNQMTLYGPYPRDKMPAPNLFRIAYNAPKLGLTPLTLTIASVADEQQAGNPFTTKRIQGQFNGSLAYVEQQPGGYDWHVVGKPTEVKGSFNVLCSMR